MTSQPVKSQAANVARSFDAVAEVFETQLENETTRKLRGKLYETVRSLLAPGGSILDINCGTGIDALALSQMGYSVVGMDISPKMVEQARARLVRFPEAGVHVSVGSFEDIASITTSSFDMVISNFGGLNCVSSLDRVFPQVAGALKPGGHFVAVVMPPVSLWELIAGITHGNLHFAFRRFQKNVAATGFGGRTFVVSYHSAKRLFRASKRSFERISLHGWNVSSPPPHAALFRARHPKLSAWLESLDDATAGLPFIRSLGDHYMLVLRKKLQ
jgi:ubiquinone/menaquinone biosynthesis C-methylase UbiE